MLRLKYSMIKSAREGLLAAQGGRCALCLRKLPADEAVLDHDHHTGIVRGALHRGCNSLLGKIENNHRRYGVQDVSAFLAGAGYYLKRHTLPQTALLHPSWKSEEERRQARNAKARAARKRVKESE